jgi:hypothetical protein
LHKSSCLKAINKSGWWEEICEQYALRQGIYQHTADNPLAAPMGYFTATNFLLIYEPCGDHHVPRRVPGSEPIDNLDMKAGHGGYSEHELRECQLWDIVHN